MKRPDDRVSPPKRNPPFLSLISATFRLGDELVFEGTSWTFRRDEHWAIVGPNGSGKSLLGDALRGRLPVVQGEVRYHFRPPSGLSHEEGIGHVSFEQRKSELHQTVVQSRWTSFEQEHALRVREYLAYERVMDINPFEVRPRSQIERRGFERRRLHSIRLWQVAPFLDRTLLSLSNGERQRVELARALCHPLRLLLLDEPFTGLDVESRKKLHHVLQRLMKTPVRVLLITTRLEELPSGITHILRVSRRKAVEAGPKSVTSRRIVDGNPLARTPAGTHPRARRLGPELFRLEDVTVRYDTRTILSHVTWRVSAGESWALLGPNGSGKTTLLSLLLGDNPQAYSNRVTVFGRPRGIGESIWELKRRIGWVSPELHLHFDETVTCCDAIASAFHGTIGLFEPITTEQRGAARRQLAQFHLLGFESAPLFALSAGLQRVALLARALVTNPPLLILDEPCQGLDAAHRRLFIRTVNSLLRAGRTTAVYVTHRSDEIPSAITRVLRLTRHGACVKMRQT
jgi:molybdate transport system ATP-binding protein